MVYSVEDKQVKIEQKSWRRKKGDKCFCGNVDRLWVSEGASDTTGEKQRKMCSPESRNVVCIEGKVSKEI